ncbi:uncharacterized protein LOC135397969 [Ornithodoros turicata]|uniref:uncharacterized protein LOC135397969 n=1 Tax=Ornithodoros turicata TaxID=34597 RepID=UPI00313A2433
MIQEPEVPFLFGKLSWTGDARVKPKVDHVWDYLHKSTHCIRQGHRGWGFKEEGYIRNVLYNTNTNSGPKHVTLVRGVCLPSMQKGAYTVSAWYEDDGTVTGAHCQCVAGLSQTCEHVAALLFHVTDSTQPGASCTDVPCAWNVPSAAKKPVPVTPLQDITFRKYLINKVTRVKTKQRLFDPCAMSHDHDRDDYKRL